MTSYASHHWLLALWKQTWWRHRHTRKVSKNPKKQNGRPIQFLKRVLSATKYTEYIVNKATGMFTTFLYPRSEQPYNNIKIKLGIFGPLLKLEKLSSDSTVWRDLSFKTIVFVSGVVQTNPNNCLQQPCYHAIEHPLHWRACTMEEYPTPSGCRAGHGCLGWVIPMTSSLFGRWHSILRGRTINGRATPLCMLRRLSIKSAVCFSNQLIVAMSIERCLSVRKPFLHLTFYQ